jgi:hypothetical protein
MVASYIHQLVRRQRNCGSMKVARSVARNAKVTRTYIGMLQVQGAFATKLWSLHLILSSTLISLTATQMLTGTCLGTHQGIAQCLALAD